jgi:hypothetical protein
LFFGVDSLLLILVRFASPPYSSFLLQLDNKENHKIAPLFHQFDGRGGLFLGGFLVGMKVQEQTHGDKQLNM